MKTEQEQGVSINVPSNYDGTPIEVILRSGTAATPLNPKDPEKIMISGTIESPFRWLEKRSDIINPLTTQIIVCRDKLSITLIINEKSYFFDKIVGILSLSNIIELFGINAGKVWEPSKLSMFIKMNRAFFPNKEDNMRLVSELKNFKATVNQQIEQDKTQAGSKTDNFSQVVNSNLPESFKVNIPLFKGYQSEEVEVEIYADIDGRDISLSLISPGAQELVESYRNKAIDEQIEAIRELCPEIVIIEQ